MAQRVKMVLTESQAPPDPPDQKETRVLLVPVELLEMLVLVVSRETKERLAPLVIRVWPEIVVLRESKENLDPVAQLASVDLLDPKENLVQLVQLVVWV